jgi:hypothetical protein
VPTVKVSACVRRSLHTNPASVPFALLWERLQLEPRMLHPIAADHNSTKHLRSGRSRNNLIAATVVPGGSRSIESIHK